MKFVPLNFVPKKTFILVFLLAALVVCVGRR